ncbi:Y-family DNA polymerase [Chitinophaga ginsengisegetis]|uniref:Y-family DNA polymerase n=1 Tax=Chitinophaga ginsengisegetis TaxID=393003 RepID=UPI000DBACD15|nr:Y-family DNA polymerase [Chitinophaga ginsengisegetis]MDR6565474.1 DNA polymerase V [Chitinophaga ginsengisegetis]MDR6645202.1 DNA polymerase V [Chitinophaga ginsengisegetis]MDR6652206.1 DNA polymerase V [Chitinophaga ginsengisegetis]
MIALVDCNNFYASCEKLFQPALKGVPIVVLSNNDGCVIARNDEAKDIGIKMGVPAFLIRGQIMSHRVSVFSSNYTLYGSLSNRVMAVLQANCELIEQYSIDEAFLFLGDLQHVDLEKYAFDLRAKVNDVGIPVTIGIAPSKTLAKMANRFAKKTKKDVGIHILDSNDKINEVLRFTQVADIWGVGKQYASVLEAHGFNTAYDLSLAPQEWIRKEMSVVGQRLWNELHGMSCIAIEDEPPAKKNICVARSFGHLLSEKGDVREALANYTAIAAAKLRKQASCVTVLQVFLQTNVFREQDRQYYRSTTVQLPVASNSTKELLHYSGIALDRIWQDGYNFKKVGILLLDLIPANQIQYGIFDQLDRMKDNRLSKAIDSINGHWGGKELVKFAVQGYDRKWKLRQEKLSPCYTTRFSDILTIKI